MDYSMNYQEAKDAILDLYSWSKNFNAEQTNPFCLFFDLIGKSDDEFGAPLCDLNKAWQSIGYKEAWLLGQALSAYGEHPLLCEEYASQLLNYGDEEDA